MHDPVCIHIQILIYTGKEKEVRIRGSFHVRQGMGSESSTASPSNFDNIDKDVIVFNEKSQHNRTRIFCPEKKPRRYSVCEKKR